MKEYQNYRDYIKRLDERFPNDEFLTINQVAEYIGRKTTTVYNRFGKAGIIKHGQIAKLDLARALCQ